MIEDFRCPYCGSPQARPDEWHVESPVSVRCPDCGRGFDVEWEVEPVFSVPVPPELTWCDGNCDFWDIDGCCGNPDGRQAAPEGCPLGFHDEEGLR